MIAIIIWMPSRGAYLAQVFDGDVLVDEISGATVPEVKRRVKAVYGIDCE